MRNGTGPVSALMDDLLSNQNDWTELTVVASSFNSTVVGLLHLPDCSDSLTPPSLSLVISVKLVRFYYFSACLQPPSAPTQISSKQKIACR